MSQSIEEDVCKKFYRSEGIRSNKFPEQSNKITLMKNNQKESKTPLKIYPADRIGLIDEIINQQIAPILSSDQINQFHARFEKLCLTKE